MSLHDFLASLPDLQPSAVTDAARDLVRPIVAAKDVHTVTTFVNEVDAALAQNKIMTYHYALFLRISQDVPWAINALRTRAEPIVLDGAVDVLGSALLRTTADALAGVGGVASLVDFIDKQMTLACVKRLFGALASKRKPSPELLAVNDALLKAAFSFIEPASATASLERLAPCMTSTLILASSPTVLKQTLPRVARLMTASHWFKLVERYQDLMAELVLIQLGEIPSPNAWFDGGVLERPGWLASCIPFLLKSGRPFGIDFFTKFLSAYAGRLQKGLPTDATQDVLMVAGLRVAALDKYMRYYLEAFPTALRAQTAATVLSHFSIIRSVEGGTQWGANDVTNTLLVMVEVFASRPELWDAVLQYPVPRTDSTVDAILKCIENMQPGSVKVSNVIDWTEISKQPRAARMPLLHMAFSTTGIPLTVAPSPDDALRFPVIPVDILCNLTPAHAKLVSRIGADAKGAAVFWSSGTSGVRTQRGRAITSAIACVNRLEAARQTDARLAIVRAAWVGTSRGPKGDNSSADQGIADVDADLAEYVKLAYRTPDADKREAYITFALLLCILVQSPRRFVDTLTGALDRFAKDPTVGPALVLWISTDDCAQAFLAFPAGLYLNKSSAKSITADVFRATVDASVAVGQIVLKVLKAWLFGPEYNASRYYDYYQSHIANIIEAYVLFFNRLTSA